MIPILDTIRNIISYYDKKNLANHSALEIYKIIFQRNNFFCYLIYIKIIVIIN